MVKQPLTLLGTLLGLLGATAASHCVIEVDLGLVTAAWIASGFWAGVVLDGQRALRT
jgi:hypothetical protein